jgi:aryl-alcohol dehydrogenase-like predicted oxidoreductase
MKRRIFVGGILAGLAVPRPAKAKTGGIPTRVLGKTGEKLTIAGEGGARFHLIPFEEGKSLVRRAYDLGINYFDMARSYADGHAEEVYGAVIPEFRKDIFLTSKSGERTRKGAEAELETSLRTLRTDHVDLWQMHNVARMQDVDRIFAPGGAMEAFQAAKKVGKCRYIGYTGCRDPMVHVARSHAAPRGTIRHRVDAPPCGRHVLLRLVGDELRENCATRSDGAWGGDLRNQGVWERLSLAHV